MCWLHYRFFFSACQNVSQSEPSKTTILPEGASDGFANNSDQPKGKKNPSLQLLTFQKLSILIWRIQCVLLSPSITTNQTKAKPEKEAYEIKETRQGQCRVDPHAKHLLDHLFPWGGRDQPWEKLCWKGAHSSRLWRILWRYKHEPPYIGFGFNSLLTNFVNGLNAI